MIEKINSFKAAIAAIIAAMTALWGWFGWLTLAWTFCMVVDYITGYGAALKNGEWSSKVAREGIWHKFGCIITFLVACVLDAVISYLWGNIPGLSVPFKYSVLFAPLVLAWYIMMEMGSILENVGKMGAPMPVFLSKALAVLNSTVEHVGDDASSDRSE